MDRGAWQATVHGVTVSDMTEQITHTQYTSNNIILCNGIYCIIISLCSYILYYMKWYIHVIDII